MKKTFIYFFTTLVILLCGFSVSAQTEDENLVQISILLDTSGSMDGLIDQAKSQLWKIVNELALSKKNGKTPKLEVALYEYGKSSVPSSQGYIRQIVSLSTDLDKISDELFKLTTNGGDEYCGQVIEEAAKNLKWNKNNNVLKIIFIAGNEPFTQGSVDYKKSCKEAITKGIIVNTIFCGDFNEGVRTNWKDGADLADGNYINIDQNFKTIYIEAPQDKKIAELGEELNQTYLSFGAEGEKKKEMQAKQDNNAKSMNMEAAIQRSVAKSGSNYNNSTWDLVDAVKDKNIDLEKVEKKYLPKEMQNMNSKEKKEYIEKKIKEREEIQNDIARLNEERKKYIDSKIKENSESNTLDAAMIKAIRSQATKKNYKF
jgi:hypothetical protein